MFDRGASYGQRIAASRLAASHYGRLQLGAAARKWLFFFLSIRAALVLSRYFLGVPFYRLEAYQALLGVPVPDTTQWDQVERVADSAYPVFEHLVHLAAQGELIYQDDTPVRILSLMKENAQAQVHAQGGSGSTDRSGMQVSHSNIGVLYYLSWLDHSDSNPLGRFTT